MESCLRFSISTLHSLKETRTTYHRGGGSMSKIGVEQSLTNVQEALRAKGYDIVELKRESDTKGLDCCVITGLDRDVLGMGNTSIQGSVIDAHGLSADEICQQVEEKVKGIH